MSEMKQGLRGPYKPLVRPCGNVLIRLADVPLERRLRAMQEIAKREGLSPEDAYQLLDLVLDPGDASGRVAA